MKILGALLLNKDIPRHEERDNQERTDPSMESFNGSSPHNVSLGDVVNTTPTLEPYSTLEKTLIILVAGSLSLVTIIGNILVMLSIKVNRNLQTVNNYFLFSLACADLIIGLCSMNLYTVYVVIGYWPLGAIVCDLWLAVDYVVSNASVMNLLIISFDRYFCVTKPLSYPVRRSTKMAGLMIAAAWVLSFVLWAPAILFWQFIVGGRTVPQGECYIQFFSNAAVTFGTAIAAFYLPVVIMIALYWRISKASRSRVKRSSRKTSKASLGEVPSQSQEEGEGGRHNDCQSRTARLSVSHPLNGRLEKNSSYAERKLVGGGPAQQEPEEEWTAPSELSENRQESERSSQRPKTSKGGTKGLGAKLPCFKSQTRSRSKPFPEPSPVAEKQNLFSRSLFKVAKCSLEVKSTKRCTSSRERKVTRTIMAILVVFVATWTPYNVMVLINTFCSTCIPNSLWTIGYWLCYINSTINPACYALCNTTFKNTFKHLLICQYKNLSSAR
ncbi:muscarinic acetylcholine receptor M2-like [Gadus macrocephalus]|uniref:muscarinic acetylcholine receptor M2-like n=1 Tax=Gadus macrocephalus TaxID=80720 RepID=UPI0028CB5993|nr:muscarinic acetylcholine receptor M2-like [Gadus macrocephalus]